MAKYLNPGKDEFARICSSEYVDKTGLILEVNKVLETKDMLTLVSRPRRFGKSFAAAMLCAYYGFGNEARELFQNRFVGKEDPLLTHFGEYNILYINFTELKAEAMEWQRYLDRKNEQEGREKEQADWIQFLKDEIKKELTKEFGEEISSFSFYQTLENAVTLAKRKFFWICDEWDLVFREECSDPNVQENYIELLRTLFKSSSGYTSRVFSGAYLTGIMPMRVMKGESAVSDFRNYTMLAPGRFAPYAGFTADEVRMLCQSHGMEYQEMADWYDGYQLQGAGSVFNPRSVMEALDLGQYESYWVRTASYENLKESIELDIGGLWETILGLVGGKEASIDGQQFDNDLRNLKNTNSVLTALVHLGYLSYRPTTRTVYIPNKEIRREFIETLSDASHRETARLIKEADGLLDAVWKRDEEEVARLVALTHSLTGDARSYNSEARLCLTVRLAFYTARDYYLTISELPGGKGYADLVFLPKKGVDKPMLIIELKWDKPVKAALDQIRDRNYPQVLEGYGGKVLLVGITYKVRGKRHYCSIEEWDKRI